MGLGCYSYSDPRNDPPAQHDLEGGHYPTFLEVVSGGQTVELVCPLVVYEGTYEYDYRGRVWIGDDFTAKIFKNGVKSDTPDYTTLNLTAESRKDLLAAIVAANKASLEEEYRSNADSAAEDRAYAQQEARRYE